MVHDQIDGKVAVDFQDCGEESFKNFDRPVRVYRWHPNEATEMGAVSPVCPIDNRGQDTINSLAMRSVKQKWSVA
jgi:hypothetical protein